MFFNSSSKSEEHVFFLVQSKALCELLWAEVAVTAIEKNMFFDSYKSEEHVLVVLLGTCEAL